MLFPVLLLLSVLRLLKQSFTFHLTAFCFSQTGNHSAILIPFKFHCYGIWLNAVQGEFPEFVQQSAVILWVLRTWGSWPMTHSLSWNMTYWYLTRSQKCDLATFWEGGYGVGMGCTNLHWIWSFFMKIVYIWKSKSTFMTQFCADSCLQYLNLL